MIYVYSLKSKITFSIKTNEGAEQLFGFTNNSHKKATTTDKLG